VRALLSQLVAALLSEPVPQQGEDPQS
jgi:hypothetical protein